MVDLSCELASIRSPNPFWLAAGPPANSGPQVLRAFETGWGGAVWKTLGAPVVNVSGRLAALDVVGQRMVGLGNLELISDRPVEDNLREIRAVKRAFPDRALVVSMMFSTPAEWAERLRQVEDTGCDGIELNLSCPHGMSERSLGAAVGQCPDLVTDVVSQVRAATRLPILVKLTPNVTDIRDAAIAACAAGADAISLINTLRGVIGVDLERFVPLPAVGDASSHSGYSGPAVKPIALRMVAELARESRVGKPLSGIGGITTWRDAAEFLSLGATNVQLCTAVMHYGYDLIVDLIAGLQDYLVGAGLPSVRELTGRAVAAYRAWSELDLNYHAVPVINAHTCVYCNLCVAACRDGGRGCIRTTGEPDSVPTVDEPSCSGCNLCSLVCPVEGCITMETRRRVPERRTWRCDR